MHFELRHAVGTRERWKTKSTLTRATARYIAEQVSAIGGVTGVEVNPLTGSVILTVDSWEAKSRTKAYFLSLERVSPVLARTKAPVPAAGKPFNPVKTFEAWSEEKNTPARLLVRTLRHGMSIMPVVLLWERLKRFMQGFLPLTRRNARANPDNLPAGAELDFTPLTNFVFLRPFLPVVLNTANAVLGAVPLLLEGVKSLFSGKLNVAVLDAAAILVSILRRDFRTVGLLVVLLGLGEMLENYTRKRSLASLTDQLALKVDLVWVRGPSGELRQARLSEIGEDEIVVVRSGSVIPVDGIVTAGEAEVNQATMTGEPLPVHRAAGGSVFAGTVVENGEIDIRPTAKGDASRLSQIVQFIENSEMAKAGIQSRAEHLADAIVPYNFLLAGLVFLVTRNLTRTASVLLVDYSCALRLATPLAILTSMRTGAEKGVLVKGGRYLEALSEVDTVVFDKTGTLTSAAPRLSDVVPLTENYTREELLTLAACLEEHFPHPVSRAVVRAAREEGLYHDVEAHDTEVRYIVAHGICSSVNGEKVVLGSRHFVEEDEGVSISGALGHLERLAGAGKSILYIAVGGRLEGILGIEDPLREEAAATVAALRSRGVRRVLMLTGDDERTAAHVARALGLDGYRSQVLPTEKASHVEALKAGGARVLMVGDGINDSPALSSAHVGVTLRDSTDIAQEVADVVLTNNRLSDLPLAIDLGRATMRRIRQNFGISVGLNTGFLAGGLVGVLPPAAGALLHNATTIGVCLNAMSSPMQERNSFRGVLDDITGNIRSTLTSLEKGTPSQSLTGEVLS